MEYSFKELKKYNDTGKMEIFNKNNSAKKEVEKITKTMFTKIYKK